MSIKIKAAKPSFVSTVIRDAMFICAPDVLLKIADGELDPVEAFTEQKLRVEGDIEKALRLKEIIELKRNALKKDI